jgi:hypothetical protein
MQRPQRHPPAPDAVWGLSRPPRVIITHTCCIFCTTLLPTGNTFPGSALGSLFEIALTAIERGLHGMHCGPRRKRASAVAVVVGD